MVIPQIAVDFGDCQSIENYIPYEEIVGKILKKFSHSTPLFDTTLPPEEQTERLHRLLPATLESINGKVPGTISFCLLCKSRPNVFKFFLEMISGWLLPSKRLNVILTHAVDFKFSELCSHTYMASEIILRVENLLDLEQIKTNLEVVKSEIKLGVASSYFAERILEVKGLSNDDKTVNLQEQVANLIATYPHYFDPELFSEMQHTLVMSENHFKALRETRHLVRLTCYQYLFRKFLSQAIQESPKTRHMRLKLFRSKVKTGLETKNVLSIVLGINFLQDKEVLDETHFIKGIQNCLSDAQAIKNSFFFNRKGSLNVGTFYIEIEKSTGMPVTNQEINLLRKNLLTELEERIEQVMHPVFMPRNEEEVMRNILILSNQIKYLRDIPQVIITFDEQTHLHLFFTIILVRVLKPDAAPVMDMFRENSTFLEYIHDSCKIVGTLRRKHEKEATIFRIKVAKKQFLRRDHSINLYEVRQAVVAEISRVVGEIRDFNGGMISKQNELLAELKGVLSTSTNYNEILLENFFYSLKPVIMRTFLEAEALRTLFLLLMKAIEERFFNEEIYTLKLQHEPDFALAMIASEDWELEEGFERVFRKLNYSSISLARFCVKVYETSYIGYIFRCRDFYKQRHFFQIIQQTIDDWDQQKHVSSA